MTTPIVSVGENTFVLKVRYTDELREPIKKIAEWVATLEEAAKIISRVGFQPVEKLQEAG